MTYRILLVDDEPIILSGIKFLIDWEANGCTVAGTARNGRQALDAIETLKPHIVICDISMPVMSGIELLKASSEKPDAPVFIMLTNYGDFNLAIDAMRFRAVDYLLKTQLEAEALEKSLEAAKQECDRRGGLARVQMADSYIQSNRSQMISGVLKKLLASSGSHQDFQDFQSELQGGGRTNFRQLLSAPSAHGFHTASIPGHLYRGGKNRVICLGAGNRGKAGGKHSARLSAV